jgi:hypothetical protein
LDFSIIGVGLSASPGTVSSSVVDCTRRIGVHSHCPERGEEFVGGDLISGGACGCRRCFFRSRGGLGGAVPLAPPDFYEGFPFGWFLRLCCRGGPACSGSGLQKLFQSNCIRPIERRTEQRLAGESCNRPPSSLISFIVLYIRNESKC